MVRRDAVGLLTAWGEWSRGGSRIDLRANSSMLNVMQLVQPASNRFAADITVDEALMVDRAVADLKRHDESLYLIIFWTFILGLGMREISGKLRVSRDSASKLFMRACGIIEGRICFTEVA